MLKLRYLMKLFWRFNWLPFCTIHQEFLPCVRIFGQASHNPILVIQSGHSSNIFFTWPVGHHTPRILMDGIGVHFISSYFCGLYGPQKEDSSGGFAAHPSTSFGWLAPVFYQEWPLSGCWWSRGEGVHVSILYNGYSIFHYKVHVNMNLYCWPSLNQT